MAKNLIIYYSRKGLAIHGADAARSESTVSSWAKKEIGE